MDSAKESTRRNYRINVVYKQISEDDADLRKRMIVGVLTEAVRRESAVRPAPAGGA
jgi:hypothetical protein